MMKIRIRFSDYEIEAELFDTPTANAISDILPINSRVITWGDELYFDLPVDSELESGATAEVEVGALAYWPPMPAFCIFFGRTPASMGNEPAAASPVNVFGKLIKTDIELLRKVRDGEPITVEAV